MAGNTFRNWLGGLLALLAPVAVCAAGGNPREILPANTTSFKSYNSDSRMVMTEDQDVITGWRSARNGSAYTNIFVQKMDSLGVLLWEGDGTPVCPFPANQDHFEMAADGFGGVVVVWEDHRQGADQPRIYAQRLNMRGEPLWGRDGLALCTGSGPQRKPQVLSDFQHGFYVVWEDGRQNPEQPDIYAQRINLAGRVEWRAEGLPIVTAEGIQQNVSIATDEKKNLYLVWEDFRNGVYWNLYAQKVDEKGLGQWRANGLDVFAGAPENQIKPGIVPDGYGGLLFVYQKYSDETKGYDIYRGRLNVAGEMIYHFASCHAPDDQVNPRIVKKGSNVLMCWEDRRSGDWDIYAQMSRIYDGIFEWQLNGVPVSVGPSDDRNPVFITSTSYNYQVVTWLRSGGGSSWVLAQKLDNFGERQWDVQGVPLCPGFDDQAEPCILPDERGGAYASWTDRRDAGTAYIYTQHLNHLGKSTFEAGGIRHGARHDKPFARVEGLRMIQVMTGDFYLVWQDFRNGNTNSDIYLQRVDEQGNPQWRRNGIPICTAPDEQRSPVLVSDGVGGVIVCWVDRRNGQDDNIYAQRVSREGRVLWVTQGIAVCRAERSQNQIQAIPDTKEGVVICWSDARSFAQTGFDLYIQRINHAGEVLWGQDGKAFARYEGLQSAPAMAPDDEGGAFITWQDNRSGYANIFLQHINSFGIYEWETGGKALAPQSQHQRSPQITRSGSDLYIVWEDARYGDGYEKLVMQRMNVSGTFLWGARGMLACNYPGKQVKPRICAAPDGRFWLGWLDERSKEYAGIRLLAQQMNVQGSPQWDALGLPLGESMAENNDYELCVSSAGNTYYVWTQGSANGHPHAFFQKVSADGTRQYDYTGMRLGNEQVSQSCPVVSINSSDKVLFCWIENNISSGSWRILGKLDWK